MSIRDGGSVGSLTFGSGKGGNATINASDFVEIIGANPKNFSQSALNALTFNSGDAGNLVVNTPKLAVTDGGDVETSTFAIGKAGNITINAFNSIDVSGRIKDSAFPSIINTSATILNESLQRLYNLPPKPSGVPGDLTLNSRQLSVKNRGLVIVKNQVLGTND